MERQEYIPYNDLQPKIGDNIADFINENSYSKSNLIYGIKPLWIIITAFIAIFIYMNYFKINNNKKFNNQGYVENSSKEIERQEYAKNMVKRSYIQPAEIKNHIYDDYENNNIEETTYDEYIEDDDVYYEEDDEETENGVKFAPPLRPTIV